MTERYNNKGIEELLELARKKPIYNEIINKSPEGLQEYENIIKRLYHSVKEWLSKKFEGTALEIRSKAYVLTLMDIFKEDFPKDYKELLDSEKGKEVLGIIISAIDDKNIESLLKQD